ncbi:MAG TPA: hypothetical protein DEQ26_03695 [Flavobacteriaceae bacterium]|nr:hypothetical protein [Flavobacteriaceae bacterium]
MKTLFTISIFILFSATIFCQNISEFFINKDQKEILMKELTSLSTKDISDNQYVVINFFKKDIKKQKGSCIDYYVSDNSFKNLFKNNNKFIQFFISEKGFEYGKNVFPDNNEKISELLFNDAEECGNYAIIFPDNYVIKKKGEYRQDLLIEYLKKLN